MVSSPTTCSKCITAPQARHCIRFICTPKSPLRLVPRPAFARPNTPQKDGKQKERRQEDTAPQ
jgi:hypothetical protein